MPLALETLIGLEIEFFIVVVSTQKIKYFNPKYTLGFFVMLEFYCFMIYLLHLLKMSVNKIRAGILMNTPPNY